jgi:hypothetical protein
MQSNGPWLCAVSKEMIYSTGCGEVAPPCPLPYAGECCDAEVWCEPNKINFPADELRVAQNGYETWSVVGWAFKAHPTSCMNHSGGALKNCTKVELSPYFVFPGVMCGF